MAAVILRQLGWRVQEIHTCLAPWQMPGPEQMMSDVEILAKTGHEMEWGAPAILTPPVCVVCNW